MDIVYFGSDVFLQSFEYLAEHHNILALYTYHNDEDYMTEFTIARRAREMGIPIHYEAIGTEETHRYYREGSPVFFSAEYDKLIGIPDPDDLPQFRGVNTHAAPLPIGRSYYPIEAAMERGATRTGVTMHKLMPRLDSGPILAQRIFDVTPDMDSVDIYLRCGDLSREMTEEIFRDFDAAWEKAIPQTERHPYWKRPEDGKLTLRHDMTRAEAQDTFRRYNSMTQVLLEGKWHYVTALMTGPTALSRGELQLAPDRWVYAVRDGHLRLNALPIPTKEE